MNFDYSEEQIFLKDQVRTFLETECTSSVTRSVLEDKHTPYDEALWRSVSEMGWMGVAVPESYGGLGLDHVYLCAIAEELGRVIAPIPFSSTVYILAEALMLTGTEDQKRRILPRLVSGEIVGCLATSEGRGYTSINSLSVRAEGGFVTGEKIPVVDGGIATHAIVSVRSEKGPSLYLVDLSADGVKREELDSIDPTRNLAKVIFNRVPGEALGEEGKGEELLAGVQNRAAVLFSFEQIGGSERCLDIAKDYAMNRYAFGQIVSKYQAIKHKFADMYVKKEIARSNAYYGAWALSTNADVLPEAAASARIAGCLSYEFSAQENLQIHGGMGFTWETDCHLHLRRARQLGLVLGGLPIWRERLVRALEERGVVQKGENNGLSR
ncbi:acyl-CoA dehydrogenase family protein [Kineobactrum salinum]|uniref:Acyl-CoA/acyl-ACP dehydrogenase n=1 Tax=Kineobactrum salinum TaxID=2708301 RepID=A0A6C0UAF7_9GAMM|nr:acyl-CoA dehydrogenase family protein [Kineobactrum salinum]QIB66814.1 acyl-CoA/acyl-ACP dehydrogenase [Kineobactrum salinum]